jgi:hypothetical protein
MAVPSNVSSNVPQIFRCRSLSGSLIKKGRRLECGEGRAGGNLELEGPRFVLEIWQKPRRNWEGVQAKFCSYADTSCKFTRTWSRCHGVERGVADL